ncbi:DNA mismatch repair protein [Wickerhamomyces ciferrii]|uniref:DNA mismatch repair protein PMS1 n=1 Tax=Wickerhamomyces ciferrii (strain ATCC 14091 / BCRC 22168 / CBS 111 / JCM 3599 / NBRC 0793 / NRRL Y-1031 F-60-10) TaxID=1206466 RepID=K0KLI3_WICCF|nr:DNA mismatch repair protein [Wickerhamomyces ciferrii]CCH43072.1 DNA mismatch repair protein [Wickerhamomyces ciferrii]
MSKITSIGKEDVHRITSGQVIIDLSTAVKELLENSIDANSKKIEIIFKNYGLDSIEIIDDGDGIDELDFLNIALKHTTSKLSNFEDLDNVDTLGFRGEAINSLCSISNLKIITTKTPPKAHAIEYLPSGEIHKKTICSRSKGTSIIITNLFNNLPVRRKDFQKNFKKEFSKCLQNLYSYALISLNLKIIVANITINGKKNIVLQTQGNSILKNNIINVFGSNGMYGLIPLDFNLDLNSNKSKLKILNHSIDYNIKINGFISKCSFGFGRSSIDRQYFFINNRPVSLTHFGKAINEVYKSFNHLQYPVFILNFEINPQFLDLNVTPDKKIILIHNEDIILEKLKQELINFYNLQDLSLVRNSTNQQSLDLRSSSMIDDEEDEDVKPIQSSLMTSSFSYNGEEVGNDNDVNESKRKMVNEISPLSKRRKIEEEEEEEGDEEEEVEEVEEENNEFEEEEFDDIISENDQDNNDENKNHSINNTSSKPKTRPSIRQNLPNLKEKFDLNNLSSFRNNQTSSTSQPQPSNITKKSKQSTLEPIFMKIGDKEIIENGYIDKKGTLSFEKCHCGSGHSKSEHPDEEQEGEDHEEEDGVEHIDQDHEENESEILEIENSSKNKLFVPEDYDEIKEPNSISQELIDGNTGLDSNHSIDVDQDLIISDPSTIKSEFNNRFLNSNDRQKNASRNYELLVDSIVNPPKIINEDEEQNRLNTLKNLSIDNIDDQEESENKLTLTVSKKDFLEMKIIGQFNLGFILVIRQNDLKQDLFIVDQHASDEKFNFETLQKITIFDSQPLVVPKKIELNALDELTIIENQQVFVKNGFKFEIDEDGEPGSRIKLISLPLSKKTVFDENDFNELIHLIKENQGNTDSIRCSKIRSMFAMRACRKSIMVGKSLNTKTMTKVIRNLGQLDKPWVSNQQKRKSFESFKY